MVEIQEESEEDSSNADNNKDFNGSTEFNLNNIASYDDDKSRNPVSKESNKADGIAKNVSQRGEDDTKRFSKPKSILKNSEKLRRGSTP